MASLKRSSTLPVGVVHSRMTDSVAIRTEEWTLFHWRPRAARHPVVNDLDDRCCFAVAYLGYLMLVVSRYKGGVVCVFFLIDFSVIFEHFVRLHYVGTRLVAVVQRTLARRGSVRRVNARLR